MVARSLLLSDSVRALQLRLPQDVASASTPARRFTLDRNAAVEPLRASAGAEPEVASQSGLGVARVLSRETTGRADFRLMCRVSFGFPHLYSNQGVGRCPASKFQQADQWQFDDETQCWRWNGCPTKHNHNGEHDSSLMRLLLPLIAGAGAACTNTLCENECWRFVAWQATFFCTEEFCPSCPHAGGCDAWCGLCDDEPLVPRLQRAPAPSGFLGDGTCDAGMHRYDGELIDFNCPEHGLRRGRLPAGADAYGIEVPCRTRGANIATPAHAGRHDRVDPKLDARRLPLHGLPAVAAAPRPLRVTCVVTLVTKVGFYCQDAAAPWSGVFVHAPYDALTLALQPGDEVSVRDAYVDEELGSTQLEVAAADDVEILNRYVAVVPLLVDAGALGSFAERESSRCLAPGAVRGPARPYNERVAHVGRRLRLGGRRLEGRPCSARRRGASTPPTPSSASGRRAPPRSTSSASGAPGSVRELRRGQPRGDRGRARVPVGCEPNLVYFSGVAAVPARRELGEPRAVAPTDAGEPATDAARRAPPLGGNPRPHYAIWSRWASRCARPRSSVWLVACRAPRRPRDSIFVKSTPACGRG